MWSGRRSRGLGYTESPRMEQRLKERLTGAAILVALIVLIVPELFHGHRRRSRRQGGCSSSEGPPMRSYTIDLGAGHSAPMQLSALSRARPPGRIVAAVSAPSAPPSRSRPQRLPDQSARVRSGADEQLAERPGGSAACAAPIEHSARPPSRQRAGTRDALPCHGGRADSCRSKR